MPCRHIGGRGIVLNLGTSWRLVISSIPHSLYLGEITMDPFSRRLCGSWR
jgi:hypothetical protein